MKKTITILFLVMLVASCKQAINKTYISNIYENQQKNELIESGIDSLTIAMIDFEIKYNDSLEGISLSEISKMGEQRHVKVISEIKKEFQTAKTNHQSSEILIEILQRLKKYSSKDELISTGIIYIETLKFSTINEISLGMDIKNVKGARKSNDKEGNCEIYLLKKKKINNLKGVFYLYVNNSKIKKIKFKSSGTFMGSTSVASYVFKKFLKERRTWVQNAMSYYEIPKWQETDDLYFYNKYGVIHEYKLNPIEMLGTRMGWYLDYIITSEKAIKNEQQIKSNNLKF